MARTFLLSGAAVLFLTSGGAPAQDAKTKEYDLAWKLPHDRAAVYEVWDVPTRTRKGEFWLLGCEWERRVGATDLRDIGYRFLFRKPKETARVGGDWDFKELGFGIVPVAVPGAPPYEAVGRYRLRQVKIASLEEAIKAAKVSKAAPKGSMELGWVDGQVFLTRQSWVGGKLKSSEKTPSIVITTLAIIRMSDGAVVGGRVHIVGKGPVYASMGDPGISKLDGELEILLQQPLVELSRIGLKDRVDRAVERGVRWLKSKQNADGRISDPVDGGPGATALAVQALVHSGVPLEEDSIRRGYSYISKRVGRTYDIGLQLMAIEAKYMPQGTLESIDTYSEEKFRAEVTKRISPADKYIVEGAAKTLIDGQDNEGGWSYAAGGCADLSNTQYAILGLKSASRLGVAVPAITWRKSLGFALQKMKLTGEDAVLECIFKSGKTEGRKAQLCGWVYSTKYDDITGSMTTAGLTILAVCRSELLRSKEWTSETLQKSTQDAEWGGLAWLEKYLTFRGTPPEGLWYHAAFLYYYIYGVERVGLLLDLQRIGQHDWYGEGAAILLSWQREDGRWEGPQRVPVLESSFALLFLKRTTLPVPIPTGNGKNP